MKIITCCKVVPDEEQIKVLPNRELALDDVPAKISQYDLNALEAAKKLFGGAGNTDDMPTNEIPAAELEGGINILDLLVKTALCPSKSEARRLVQQGGVSVDDVKVTDPNAAVEIAESVIIKKGKKVYHKVTL